MRLTGLALAIGVGLAAVACGDDGDLRSNGPSSVVVLGDSIAAGEGIRYGFTYNPASRTWEGPARPDPSWQPPIPACHQSRRAYGDLVAAGVGATLTKLACTGASYRNGIVARQLDATGADYGPAQFGKWHARQHLNRRYDAARPDLVLVTLGADDVRFSTIVTACVVAAAIDPTACTAANPGGAADEARRELLPELRRNYRALVRAIQERGAAAGTVPAIVFTTYPDPLPPAGAPIAGCHDVLTLGRDQLDYLSFLLDQLNDAIRELARLDGVEVADVAGALRNHEFCTDDPWAYGLSIRLADPTSPAPFHPTPAGQRAIAAVVAAIVT